MYELASVDAVDRPAEALRSLDAAIAPLEALRAKGKLDAEGVAYLEMFTNERGRLSRKR